MDSEWDVFIKEKAPEQGKEPEDFAVEFSYQAELHFQLKKNEVYNLTRAQLEEMYADWQADDGQDAAEPEQDEPSKLIWSWNKDKGIPRSGFLDT